MPDGPFLPTEIPIVFSTAALPQRSRLDAWNAAFGRLNEITLPEPDAPTLAWGRHWDLGSAVIGHNRVSAARFRRDALRVRRDGLDHWVIRVLRHGECRLRHGGFGGRLLAGEPVLLSLSEIWLSEWAEAEWVSVTLPRAQNPELSRHLAERSPGPLKAPFAAEVAALLCALPEQLAAAQPHELPALAERLRRRLYESLLPSLARDDSRARRERVREAIRRRIASARLTPASLAAELGLSRSALYRLFEGEGGVARHIQAIRLAQAYAALRDPARRGESVAAIGAAQGFPDPAVFSRSFRRAFGLPPGAARGAAPGDAAPAHEGPSRRDLALRLYGQRGPRAPS